MKNLENNIKKYLGQKIDGWYRNVNLDYGVSGHFVDARVVDNELLIKWVEDGETYEKAIVYFQDYANEELYNIWMEA